MEINIETIEELIDSDISAYAIEQATSVSRMTITNYRNGKSDIMNMTLSNALELQKFALKLEEEEKMVKTWSDYRGMAEGKYLADLGDYTLYLNDDKDIVRVLHENINRWQSEDEPRVFPILESELEGILYEAGRYENPVEFEDEDGVVWTKEDIQEMASSFLNEIFA